MDTLSQSQIMAAAAIASGKKNKEAAVEVGVTPQTISKWMQIPEFGALIRDIKIKFLYEAQDALRGLANEATSVLAALLKESSNEKTRLEVAKYILDTVKIAPTSKDFGLWYVGTPNYRDILE